MHSNSRKAVGSMDHRAYCAVINVYYEWKWSVIVRHNASRVTGEILIYISDSFSRVESSRSTWILYFGDSRWITITRELLSNRVLIRCCKFSEFLFRSERSDSGGGKKMAQRREQSRQRKNQRRPGPRGNVTETNSSGKSAGKSELHPDIIILSLWDPTVELPRKTIYSDGFPSETGSFRVNFQSSPGQFSWKSAARTPRCTNPASSIY